MAKLQKSSFETLVQTAFFVGEFWTNQEITPKHYCPLLYFSEKLKIKFTEKALDRSL